MATSIIVQITSDLYVWRSYRGRTYKILKMGIRHPLLAHSHHQESMAYSGGQRSGVAKILIALPPDSNLAPPIPDSEFLQSPIPE